MRVAALLALLSGAAHAARQPLVTLPPDKLTAMAPLLKHGEVALIESRPNGRLKQVTILALVAAAPELVHEVLVTPEKYPEFISNLTKSKVTRFPDGTYEVAYTIDFKLTHFYAINRFRPNPDGAVDEWGTGEDDDNTFRWEMYRVAGGTLLVRYGYTDLTHTNSYIHSVVEKIPSMEHGLAVAAQLVFVRSIKARAEKLAPPGSFPPLDPAAKGPGFDFLLRRGRVAVIRSLPNGRLADISILDRAQAPKSKLEAALDKTGDYASFIDGVKKSRELSRKGGEITYETEAEAPVFNWETRFTLHEDGAGGIDVVGVDGDLAGVHYRWDLTPLDEKRTMVVFRARQDLAAASPLLFGVLFRTEPLFEHGMSVAMGLVQVVSFRGRAEGTR